MFKKSLIAVAAIATVVSFASAPAKAETNIEIGFGIGGGFDSGFGYPEYGDDGFDGFDGPGFHHRRHGFRHRAPIMRHRMNCGEARNVVRRAGFNAVRAFDCSAPTYGFKAWRDGEVYKVKVGFNGNIISVRPIW